MSNQTHASLYVTVHTIAHMITWISSQGLTIVDVFTWLANQVLTTVHVSSWLTNWGVNHLSSLTMATCSLLPENMIIALIELCSTAATPWSCYMFLRCFFSLDSIVHLAFPNANPRELPVIKISHMIIHNDLNIIVND